MCRVVSCGGGGGGGVFVCVCVFVCLCVGCCLSMFWVLMVIGSMTLNDYDDFLVCDFGDLGLDAYARTFKFC